MEIFLKESGTAGAVGQKSAVVTLMRGLACGYLLLALIDFIAWLAGGLPALSSISVYNLFSWFFYVSGVLAIVCFLIQRSVISGTAWRAIVLGYILFRYLELKLFGAVLVQSDVWANAYRIARYVLIAAPPALAMLYMGFRYCAPLSAGKQGDAWGASKRGTRSGATKWSDNLLP